jgi:hypothetical protein
MSIRGLFVVLLFADVFMLGMRETVDPDMWWHLRTGEVIVQSGVPHEDPFSFTVRGHRWITHEWLSEAVMWPVYRVGGLPALFLLFAAVATAAFGFVYRCSDGRPYLAGAIALLGATAGAPSLGVRPQVFTVLLAAVFVHLLERFARGEIGRRPLLLLPLLSVAWVNLHGGYLFGVALLLIYAAGEALDRRRGEDPTARGKSGFLVALAAACLVSAVLNPNGTAIWTYPLHTLTSSPMQRNIAEWQSPNFHSYAYWPFGAMLGLGALGWALSPRRPPARHLLLFFGLAAAGLLSRRHIALFGVATVPVLAHSLTSLLRGTRVRSLVEPGRRSPMAAKRGRLHWALACLAVSAFAIWAGVRVARSERSIAREYPVGAVEYLARNGIGRGRGYNAYQWGGYLIWRGVPVFIDGRADVYGDDFLGRYVKTMRLDPRWPDLLDQFGVDYVLVEPSKPLAAVLLESRDWRSVYEDHVAEVFVRADKEKPAVGGAAQEEP